MQRLQLTAALSLLLSGAVSAETFVVRDPDSNCEDARGACGSNCTLRDALEAAKNNGPGQDVINFDIASPGSGTILVCSSGRQSTGGNPRAFNPEVFDSSVRVNGYSQPGTRKNTATDGSFNGVIRIRLVALESAKPWTVDADDVSLRGVELFAGNGALAFTVSGDRFELLGSRLVSRESQPSGGMVLNGNLARIGSDALDEHRNVWVTASGRVAMRIEGDGVLVRNNLFGRSASLDLPIPALSHIVVGANAQNTVIGLPGTARENVFSSAVQSAIVVEAKARQGTRIESNRFVGNTGIAIDLGDDGVSGADSGDGDGVQNAAFIREATAFLANPVTPATVRGQLLTPTTVPQQYSLEVYRNPAGCHPSGNGEGEFPIHRQTLTLGPGTAEFTLTLPTTATNQPNRSPRLQNGEAISVLVTSTGGDTSEFSRCAIVGAPAQEPPAPTDNAAFVVRDPTNSVNPGTYRDIVTRINQSSLVDRPIIAFALPGSIDVQGVGLACINRPVIIDGYTQSAVDSRVRPNSATVGTNARPGVEFRDSVCFANPSAAAGSVIRGVAFTEGVPVGGVDDGVRLEGNFFGATAAGELTRPENGSFVVEAGTVLGGDQPAHRNWLPTRSGSAGGVVLVRAGGVVRGNLLGVDRDGVTPLLDPAPVDVISETVTVFDAAILEDNVIGAQFSLAFKARGIRATAASGIALRRNRFVGNAQPIDLEQSGVTTVAVTPNDPDDVDSNGANGLQNFPELQLAFMDQGQIRIDGRLDRPADSIPRKFALDFYASNSCNANGHGPGEILLGSRELVSDDATQEAFSFSLSAAGIDPTMVLTAIATEVATGNSSEMSACLAISGNPNPPPDPGAEDRIFANGFE